RGELRPALGNRPRQKVRFASAHATDNTSPRSPRSGEWRPSCSGPARPEHRPAAASRRSLQACIASLPLQSSWMSKTYLKSDHFNGGGSTEVFAAASGVALFSAFPEKPSDPPPCSMTVCCRFSTSIEAAETSRQSQKIGAVLSVGGKA